MLRTLHPWRLLMLLALLCASLASAAPPATAAAGKTYYVDSTRDDGSPNAATNCIDSISTNKNCTLRQALLLANSDGVSTEIRFRIPATSDPDYSYSGGVWTITPATSLPTLSAGDTTIIGILGGSGGAPRVVIDGKNVPGTSAIGFKITSANNSIQRLAINNFQDTSGTNGIGILITGASAQDNVITSNYIGVGPVNIDAQPNTVAGVRIDTNASNNTIGGPDPYSDRNLISGNGTQAFSGSGILLSSAKSNTIQGNLIGLAFSSSDFSTVVLGNTGVGIRLIDSSNNLIGGDVEAYNIISGNGQAGVLLSGSGTMTNTLQGNLIGTDDSGFLTGFGNGADGVQILSGASNNTIIGDEVTPSVISGNAGYGVRISDNGTDNNQILGGYIGADLYGATAVPNGLGGVRIQDDASGTVVGAAGQGNVISGNTGYGVSIGSSGAFTNISGNTLAANYIGLSAGAVEALPNSAGGVLLGGGARSNLLGGSSSDVQNIISGNTGPGVVISGTTALDNVVTGNVIGLKLKAGTSSYIAASPNGGDGIWISNGAKNTRVGGSTAEANVIAANGANGVRISDSGTTTTTLQANLIGTAKDGSTLLGLGNGANGVRVEGQATNVLISANTIFSNTLNGVLVTDNAQKVKLVDNSFSRNSAKDVDLDPQTSGAPGLANNPNHDIDPPFALALDQNGNLTGRVRVDGSQAACASCTIQLFTSDPVLLDGQARDRVLPTNTITPDLSGNFSVHLQSVPPQVLVNATDSAGNSSEFSLIGRLYRVDIGPTPLHQDAVPGQTVTFTHLVTNTGTIDMTDLVVTATSSLNWPLSVAPATTFGLKANESRSVTLTLTLPTGADTRVYAGKIDSAHMVVHSSELVTVTDGITDTTTVLPKFLLDVSPTTRSAIAQKSSLVPLSHTLTNNGNITTTVELTAATDLGWDTSITPLSYQLTPGKSIDATALISVPDSVIAPTEAKTIINITSPGQSDRAQDKILTDTITITSTALATITPGEYEGEGAATETVSFQHVVTNLSNGPVTFKLFGASSQGSVVTFRSASSTITLGADNTFTLGIDPGTDRLNFFVDIVVDQDLLPGNKDTITIGLMDARDDTVIGGAVAQDTITVTQGALRPRIWLPLVSSQQ